MDREMEWNAEVTKIHHINYVRNSRAITVAWFVFSACYTILNIVAFIQPFWFGDTKQSPGVGYFGLFEWCERGQGSEYSCTGNFLDFNTLMNDYFRASSFLVGGAALLFIFSIICMLLFLFLKPALVLKICGWLQLIAAVFMTVACIIYPNAFDDDNVKRICGQDATAYNMDKCQIRWAYILAIVLIFDALILAVLAFVLAARQAKMLPEFKKMKEEDHLGYIHEWRDDPINNNGYKRSIEPTPAHMQQQQQQVIRQRHSYTSLDVGQRNTHKYESLGKPVDQPVSFTNFGFAEPSDVEPIVLPEDSLNGSNPTSPRSEEGRASPRSQTSQSSQDLSSPRSAEYLDLEAETSPRSFVSDEPEDDDHINSMEGDIRF